jgi:hypothetical protein
VRVLVVILYVLEVEMNYGIQNICHCISEMLVSSSRNLIFFQTCSVTS